MTTPASRPHLPRRTSLPLLVIVLLIAFAAQLIVLSELRASSPYILTVPDGVDQIDYVANARAFAAGEWPRADEGFELSPYMSLYLGIIFASVGDVPGLDVARVGQTLIGVLTVALTYHLGRRLFSPAIGLVAALALALYSPALFYNTELTTAPHTTLLVTGALVLVETYGRRAPHSRYAILAGLVIGLGAWARPNVLVVLGGFGLWLWGLRLPARAKWRGILLLGLAAALALLPPAIHNTRATGMLSLTTTTGPYNLYIGNNPGATGVFQHVPDDLKAAIARGETSYSAEVRRFITGAPLDWLALLGRKIAMYLVASDMELGSNVNYHFWGVAYSTVLRVTGWVLRYELIALLALLGSVLIRRRRGVPLLYLSLLAYMAGVVLFFMQARIRMAFVPVLIVLAVATAAEIIQRWRRGDRLVLILVIAVLVAYGALLVRYAYLLSGGIQIIS